MIFMDRDNNFSCDSPETGLLVTIQESGRYNPRTAGRSKYTRFNVASRQGRDVLPVLNNLEHKGLVQMAQAQSRLGRLERKAAGLGGKVLTRGKRGAEVFGTFDYELTSTGQQTTNDLRRKCKL